MVVRKSPRPVERIAKNTPETWCATFSYLAHAVTLKHYNTGVYRRRICLSQLGHSIWFLLPKFSVHTVRLKCTEDMALQQNFTPSLHAGDKPRGPKPCTEPGTMNSLSRLHCSRVIQGSKQHQHFWQASAPGSTFVTALVGSALP